MQTTSAHLPPVATRPETIRVDLIDRNLLNPRSVPPPKRPALAESLKAVGQLARVWVRPHPAKPGRFELVDGERRWWGAQHAGRETLDALVGDWTDEHVIVIALTTAQAEPLDPLEEAKGLKWWRDEKKASLREVAERFGYAFELVRARLAVIDGPQALVTEVESGALSITAAAAIVLNAAPSRVLEALEEVMQPVRQGLPALTVKATESLVRRKYGKARAKPVVAEGQVALTDEESAKVFPGAAEEPAPESGFVAYTRPIPADLLKPEVAETAPVKFADVAKDVQVHVGVTAAGRSVELVKVSEALAAVAPDDRHIFKEEVARTAGMPKLPAGEAPSRRVEEEAAERERKRAEKAQRKKDKASGRWLEELLRALESQYQAPGGIVLWSLLWDRALELLTEDDARFLCVHVLGFGDGIEDPTAELMDHARDMDLAPLAALTAVLLIAPVIRVRGADCELAKEWHEAVIAAPKVTSPDEFAAAGGPEDHIGESTDMVEGAPAAADVGQQIERLKGEVEQLFALAGMEKARAKDDAAKLACKRPLAEMETVEQWTALRDTLARVVEAKAKKAAARGAE